jgi:hypothetical protein
MRSAGRRTNGHLRPATEVNREPHSLSGERGAAREPRSCRAPFTITHRTRIAHAPEWQQHSFL